MSLILAFHFSVVFLAVTGAAHIFGAWSQNMPQTCRIYPIRTKLDQIIGAVHCIPRAKYKKYKTPEFGRNVLHI